MGRRNTDRKPFFSGRTGGLAAKTHMILVIAFLLWRVRD
jgi:hypothetical protein